MLVFSEVYRGESNSRFPPVYEGGAERTMEGPKKMDNEAHKVLRELNMAGRVVEIINRFDRIKLNNRYYQLI